MTKADIDDALDMLYGGYEGWDENAPAVDALRETGPNEITITVRELWNGRTCTCLVRWRRLSDRTELQYLVHTRQPA